MGLYSEQRLKHYVIKDQIASGGMGEVWRAWDEVRNQFVAIKAITDDLFFDANFSKRFLDEGRRHLKLTHPNIVPVLDVFNADNQNCLVMELIEGMSLADLIKSRPERRLNISEAIPIIQDLLNALNYAHMHGIIHRDVKPSNVLLDKKGRGYLIDFGIALAIGEDRRTRTGQTIGTPHYMSPEQIISPREIDHRTDVYSVGCVFYEMLTGRPPFIADLRSTGDVDFAIKRAHVNMQPIPPAELVRTIPAYINDVIMLALQKKPDNRLPGCQEFLRMLNEDNIKQPQSRVRWVYFIALVSGIFLLLLISLLLI
ncbi:MAG: serine/threonine-protein kinase [Methylococcales bacterium]|nr:serine/threonine-protein kinase [Methylococcales bacterium]